METVFGWLGCLVLVGGMAYVAYCLARNEDRPFMLQETPLQFSKRPGAESWRYGDWLCATAADFEGVALWGPGYAGVVADDAAARMVIDAEEAAREYAE